MLQAFRISGVIIMVDSINGMQTLERYKEIRRQVAFADRIVLTKTDMQQDVTTKETLSIRLAATNPGAEIVEADFPSLNVRALFEIDTFNPDNKADDVRPLVCRRGI